MAVEEFGEQQTAPFTAAMPEAVEALKNCDMLIDCIFLLFSPEQFAIQAAGTRTDPPVSDPMAAGARPKATEAAAPEEGRRSLPAVPIALAVIIGAIIGFEIAGGVDAGKRFVEALTLHSHVANIGDVRSLVIHPASTTHSQLTPEEQLAAGVTPGLVRLAVGIEGIDDILADLDRGFAAARAFAGSGQSVASV